MNLTLYYAPVACSLVPYVTLTEAGADFDVKVISLAKKEQMNTEFAAINPKRKVPCLVVDGQPLTENVAIQVWIAGQFPATRLLPENNWERVHAISHLSWCASGFHPHMTRIFKPTAFCSVADTENNVREIATDKLMENFHMANDVLANREFFFDHFTAADAYFFWCYRRSTLFDLDMSSVPHCQAHFENMLTRDSVKRVLAFEKEVQALSA